MIRMNARQLAARLRAAAVLLDTITAIAVDPIAFLDDLTNGVGAEVARKKLHWTQMPKNKAKLRNMNRKTGRKIVKKAGKKTGRKVLHWTQEPANKAKVRRMTRASAKKRLDEAKVAAA